MALPEVWARAAGDRPRREGSSSAPAVFRLSQSRNRRHAIRPGLHRPGAPVMTQADIRSRPLRLVYSFYGLVICPLVFLRNGVSSSGIANPAQGQPMASTAPYDAREIANFLLDLADERGNSITQITVLKVIYFAHGWYLTYFGKPLISNDFEAWQHGPVIKVVRDSFKECGAEPIKARAKKLVLVTGNYEVVIPKLSHEDEEFVKDIYNEYSKFSAWQLSDMTHEPGSPWHRLWHAKEAVGRVGLRIRNDDIRAHFASARAKGSVS